MGLHPVTDLREQRDAILRGRWTQGEPTANGEGCAVLRRVAYAMVRLEPRGVRALAWAIAERGNEWPISRGGHDALLSWCGLWNDMDARQLSDVVDALDRALVIAKEHFGEPA